MPSSIVAKMIAKLHEFVHGKVDNLDPKAVRGDIDAAVNQKIIDGFTKALDTYMDTLTHEVYKKMLVETVSSALEITDRLNAALSLSYSSDIVYDVGAKYWRDALEVRESHMAMRKGAGHETCNYPGGGVRCGLCYYPRIVKSCCACCERGRG